MTDENENYEVKVKETHQIPTGEKQTLQLIDKDKNEVVREQKASFSQWQLEDDEAYEDRLRQWAKKRIREVNGNSPKDREGKTMKI